MKHDEKILVDTNLLILFIVGLVDENYIEKHKNCFNRFDKVDFKMLRNMLSFFKTLILTPNTLTETSNLLRQTSDREMKRRLSSKLDDVIQAYGEIYIESKIASKNNGFLRLGLTDSVLDEINKSGIHLLTSDLDLFLLACERGVNATNFFHVKDSFLD